MRRLLTLLLILILNAQWIGSAAASIPHSSFSGSAINQGTASSTPTAPTVFSSAAQLSLLAPVGQSYLLGLLPPELRPGSTTFLMDAWLEQQTLRQAALRETGQSTFIAGLAYDEESGLSVDSQQRALLYQNAARFATAEGIKLGGALSDAQQTKLTEPLLWYVEETITGPDGKTLAALVPKLYLPAGQLDQWANVAGGVIRGQDITLDAGTGTIDNTGYVAAGNTLTVNAGELVNRARSAAWGSYTQDVEGGLLEVWGDRVQPGGFLSAAKLDLNVGRVASISGAFLQGGTEVSGQLASRLSNYSRSENRDNVHTQFHADESFGLDQVVVMAVAIAVSVYTAGAASGAIATAAGESAAAAATAAGATAAQAAAAGIAAASAAATSVSTAMISSAAGAMAGNATAQALATGTIDTGSLFSAGLSGAISGGVAGYYGSAYSVERIAAQTVSGCASGEIMGAGCGAGTMRSLATGAAAWGYNSMVGYDPSAVPGENSPAGETKYFVSDMGRQLPDSIGKNVIGFNRNMDGSGLDFYTQGGPLSRFLNYVPGINATAGLHDYVFNSNALEQTFWNNIWTMLPAAALTYPAILNTPSSSWFFMRPKNQD